MDTGNDSLHVWYRLDTHYECDDISDGHDEYYYYVDYLKRKGEKEQLFSSSQIRKLGEILENPWSDSKCSM